MKHALGGDASLRPTNGVPDLVGQAEQPGGALVVAGGGRGPVVAISARTVAFSGALVAFGLDSVIGVASAAAVTWQFSAHDPDVVERRERRALQIIAVAFFALAVYVTGDSVPALLGSEEASTLRPGWCWPSLAIMPGLSYAQRRAGREPGSASAVAESKQTLLCTYLSAVLLVGLAVNSLFGWSWADPIAALVIAAVAVKEGREAWCGDACCTLPASAGTRTPVEGNDCRTCRPGCACRGDSR
ncbi:cation transporter [Actinomadura syzygii]|uniref:cation transporter n=1 Tax=Actinomadura syzygii TaxID=1427538 RepID=UPI001FE762B3|nr:cation transporter [Actinomadura syzygii]